jgi:LytS/YehU family sensor histidine kinase
MKHAVSKMSQPSRIDVGVRREGESLVLAVRDSGTGAGTPSGAANGDAPGAAGMGIGLSNTRARLDELYGDQYSLTFAPDGSGGHVVTVTLPYHTASDLRGLTTARATR